MNPKRCLIVSAGILFGASGVFLAAMAGERGATSGAWESRAIPESQYLQDPDTGLPIRYDFAPFSEWPLEMWYEYPTHAYDSKAKYPEPRTVSMPVDLKGDPDKGRQFLSEPPCSLCHLTPQPVFAMGSIGPDLRLIGERGLTNEYLFQVIYDARVYFGESAVMPPFGVAGVFTDEDIVHMVAYLQTLTGDPPGTPKVPEEWAARTRIWNPFERAPQEVDRDHLDPLDNPGILELEGVAVERWQASGPKGRSCADCHGTVGEPDETRPLGVVEKMKGVYVTYPKWFEEYGRLMQIEDLLTVHAPETTGEDMLAQSMENIAVAALIKSQSNGMKYSMNKDDPAIQAAVKRGEELWHRSVGWFSFACSGCHSEQKSGGKRLADDYAPVLGQGLDILNYPKWRFSYDRVWDQRIRLQFCGMPTRYLPGDAPEYVDLETFLLSHQDGAEVVVPRATR